MKPRLSPALHQHLVLTPQLRQAIRLLQLSTAELEAEVADAVASNPLLDWTEETDQGDAIPGEPSAEMLDAAPQDAPPEERWDRDAEPWQERIGPGGDGDEDMGDPGDRDLGECLRLQLLALPAETPGRALALDVAAGPLARLPRMGLDGLCAELDCRREDADAAVQLLRSLDPRPGSRCGELPPGTYVTPDCVIWRQQGMWRVALASNAMPRIAIQRGYEQMIRHARPSDADYLRGRLQEARWLLKGLESRADTLLRVVRCLVREQAAFLEFGAQALHPLTLRRVAEELGMHESTVSRAIARKYVRTPRGTIALRDFFASGIETGDGGSASSTAIQDMIRKLVAAEDPRKPLSDARLADTLKAEGVPVARRTVAKYREALQIPASHERVRIG